MEVGEAIEQIHAIRAQISRTEVFRGYRAATVGCTGVLAFLAAAIQPIVLPDPVGNIDRYLQLWIGVAAISVVGVAIELATRWISSNSSLQREQTRHALEQFLPCLLAGATMTWSVFQYSPSAANLLPGLWAVTFSLGVFASCRQLPVQTVLVATYYLVAGAVCLAIAQGPYALHPLAMAGTFGIGQTLTAVVLYLALERRDAEQ